MLVESLSCAIKKKKKKEKKKNYSRSLFGGRASWFRFNKQRFVKGYMSVQFLVILPLVSCKYTSMHQQIQWLYINNMSVNLNMIIIML